MDFKTSQRGSLLKTVNCAYSSQVCPSCGWVEKSNQSGDSFMCRQCRFTGESDHVAALELLRRDDEPEITLAMSKTQVKMILLARFRRRLESGGNLTTIPGKTPGSFCTTHHPSRREFPPPESPPESETRP